MAGGSRKIEMTWACTSCGHRNLGRHKDCEKCGNPKDASERYEMPGATGAAPTVTDPAMLRMAQAGPDWRCTYCGTDTRALFSTCVKCGAARDGTPAVQVGAAAVGAPRPVARGAQGAARRTGLAALGAFAAIAAALVTCVAMGAVWALMGHRAPPAPVTAYVEPQPEILAATVVAREWRTSLLLERYRRVEREGFEEQRPADALEITPDGRRHHHDEQVPDGTTTETYFEDVPYQDTETYTESVACGEDCTDSPETCTEHCSDDGNGFATCTTSCSGGGRTCTPRTCTETRTRPVTRTRSEPRTRTVPRFRSEPRDAPWYRWRIWAWTPERTVERSGTSEAPAWPDEAELDPRAPLADGEEERIVRSWTASVRVRDERGREHAITPGALEALDRYEIGAVLEVEVSGHGSLIREMPRTVAIADAGVALELAPVAP